MCQTHRRKPGLHPPSFIMGTGFRAGGYALREDYGTGHFHADRLLQVPDPPRITGSLAKVRARACGARDRVVWLGRPDPIQVARGLENALELDVRFVLPPL